MPIYEYLCQDCAATYEHLVRSSAERIACPKCGSNKKNLQFSVFASPKPNGSSSDSAGTASAASACACTPRSCGCH
ncbi:MAG TPA: zinc ribbon domain-containing protein [Candidatus Acidoferrales bacterium]|nr:zinc ribbon domain-containing protein [Candidatus Acidoferrales bacterium]